VVSISPVVHDLPSGSLEVSVTPGEYELGTLCAFAARQNPKRGFLFVSKVLGRYLPVRPSRLAAACRALTSRLPANLEGPIVVMGVAEAGIALAHGVHRELARAGRSDALFSHTTRYRFDRELVCEFDEPHSHAPAHRVYLPERLTDRALMDHARTLIVVDDEVTTGRTFTQFVHRYHARFPQIRRVHHLVLTDWHQGDLVETVAPPSGVDIALSALLEGHYHFRPDPRFTPRMPDVRGNGHCKARLVRNNHGRFALRRTPAVDPARIPPCAPGDRVLVLGSGEFLAPPLLVAEALEAKGANVWFQSTTRAPVLPGGAIQSVLAFEDNYEERMPNYLYNVERGHFDRVFLCLETPEGTAPASLLKALDATPIYF